MIMYCVKCEHRWEARTSGFFEECPNCEHSLPLSGIERRDAGMASVEANNEQWNEKAYAAVYEVALKKEFFTVDDLSHFKEKPKHPNAWGPVWRNLIRDRVIQDTGRMVRVKDPKKHARRVPVYRSLVFGRR
jgi:hypothetical protein